MYCECYWMHPKWIVFIENDSLSLNDPLRLLNRRCQTSARYLNSLVAHRRLPAAQFEIFMMVRNVTYLGAAWRRRPRLRRWPLTMCCIKILINTHTSESWCDGVTSQLSSLKGFHVSETRADARGCVRSFLVVLETTGRKLVVRRWDAAPRQCFSKRTHVASSTRTLWLRHCFPWKNRSMSGQEKEKKELSVTS